MERSVRRRVNFLLLLVIIMIFTVLLWSFILHYKSAPQEITVRVIEYHRDMDAATIEIKRKLPSPPLQNSIELLSTNNSFSNSFSSYPLLQFPDLSDTKNATCVPNNFGFSDEDAKVLFDQNRRFVDCLFRLTEDLHIIDNKLTIDCEKQYKAEYVMGSKPEEELLGEVDFKFQWKYYSEPVDLEDREFAFSRCMRSKKQAVLINKFKKSASERALNKTKSISEDLKMTETPRPMTVLLVLFDSLSRQHAYRNLPKTMEYLNSFADSSSSYAIYDFLINNAHGPNTQPNMVPLLYGYDRASHEKRLESFSIQNQGDWWKFRELQSESIWKFYENLGYVTMLGYDTVWDFVSFITGREILTDHVATNFWHAARKIFGYLDFLERQRCLGTHHSHWYLLNYASQFMKNYKGHNRFGYIHLSPAHESTGTVIRTADSDLKDFFVNIFEYFKNHPEEDFAIHLMSDHGKHSREWDKYDEGFRENQLPLHILIANKDLISRLGEKTDEILKHNTKRLVSRLDWYLTFKNLALSPYGKLSSNSELYNFWKSQNSPPSALSLLLEKINDKRICEDVDIPAYFCSCIDYVDIPLEKARADPEVKLLIALGLQSIIRKIAIDVSGQYCHNPTLKNLLTVQEKQLKPYDEGGNKKIKASLSINESISAVFEFIGYVVSDDESFKFFKSNEDGLHPIGNYTLVSDIERTPMQLQIQSVTRLDIDEKCLSVSKEVHADYNTCICKL
ncbi:unnamed protein product [Blepharisma stoltei]|uniref:Uncharacterized protein n=1 Tax=Blepharisma stoltei TaxID=1481888 RepID=A0AAU9JAL1_9CILI|nr:unnamed protein product [Blepharisma stoltei]